MICSNQIYLCDMFLDWFYDQDKFINLELGKVF